MQVSLCPYISIFEITPNLLIPFVVVSALIDGPVTGAVVGAAAGLFADALCGGTGVLFTITYMYIAVISGFIHLNYLRKNVMIAVAFTFLGTWFTLMASFLLHFTIWGRGSFLTALWRIMLPTSFYSAVLTVPIYYLFHMLRFKKNREGYS